MLAKIEYYLMNIQYIATSCEKFHIQFYDVE